MAASGFCLSGWPLSFAFSLAVLHTTFRPQEVALSAEWPLAQSVFIHAGSASGTARHRDDARWVFEASAFKASSWSFKRDRGAEPPPRRTQKVMLVKFGQHFYFLLRCSKFAARPVVVRCAGGLSLPFRARCLYNLSS